jgi:gamma-glutamylcysteine synthetase
MAIELDKLYIRLYHGNANDEKIAAYLSQYDKSSKGIKHTRVKELLYLGLQALEQETSPHRDLDAIRQIVREEMAQVTPSLDQDAVRRAVQEAMQSTESEESNLDFTLSDIRQVVSVVLDQKFDRLDIAVKEKNRAEADPDEQAKVEEDLAHLFESLEAF